MNAPLPRPTDSETIAQLRAWCEIRQEDHLKACRRVDEVIAERDAARLHLAQLQRALARLHRSNKPPAKETR